MAPSKASAGGGTRSQKGRLRLIVIQALVFSLFATLFARLYYLQVVSGDEYHAQAASQSVREIVVQPQRGLIVDAMGRPLVTNRPSWVISVDRTMLGKMSEDQQARLVARLAGSIDRPTAEHPASGSSPAATRAACPASAGTARRTSRSRWPPTSPSRSRCASSSSPRTSRRCSPSSRPCATTRARSASTSPTSSATSARSPRTSTTPPSTDGDRSVNGASAVGRAGVEKQYDAWLRGMPGYRRVAVDSMGRVLGDDSELAGQPGDTLVTSIDAKVQSVVEKQLADRIAWARTQYDKVTHKNYVADSGAAIVMEAKTGRIVAMASQPTYDPSVWVGGITKNQLARLYSEKAGTPAARPGHPGPVRARARRGSR